MGGMKFEYDESGGKFFYFLLSVYALILLPITYFRWPNSKKESKPHIEETINFLPCRDKYRILNASKPNHQRRAIITKIVLIIAWILFVYFAYRVSLIETEHKEYDPFIILDIDREASINEIKRAYRELSKVHHPDRGGDAEKFKEIARAYKALTDEEAKENWKKYGNPDGPGVTHFGIALPKWLVDHQNSIFVLFIYTGIFMIVLPVIICTWWQKSARYAGDEVLNSTVQLYLDFLSNISSIHLKRIITILSASAEFDRMRNPVIIDRLSDNTELPKLCRDLPEVQVKKREPPFCAPFSVKARILIYAHLRRFNTLSDDLEKDKRYLVTRSIYLLKEMINVQALIVFTGEARNMKYILELKTIEDTMKLSPMLVQALIQIKSPLLQLPHITEAHLKYFENKKSVVKSIRQFVALENEKRRSILRSLTDEQYCDIMNVVATYPYVTMKVSCEVFDEEDKHIITAGAIVTLTVHLHRENMSSIFSKELNANLSTLTNAADDETNEDQAEDKDDRDKQANETVKASATTTASSKVWQSKSEKKKKAKKKGHASSTKANNKQTPAPQTSSNNKAQIKNENKDSSDDDSSKHSDDGATSNVRRRRQQAKEDLNEIDNELHNDGSDNEDESASQNPSNEQAQLSTEDNEDDEFLERFQQQRRKREKLETKEKSSHRVFCPFYPAIKQECWWLYVADRKNHSLISAPIYICTLKNDEEFQVQFTAPKQLGHCSYSVILRSDSYFDVDVVENLSLDVEAAKETVKDHPQWKCIDEDDAANNNAEDEEFQTESESESDKD